MKREAERRERGFTLIELMVVVVIIGILSMIAYPAYTRYLMSTRRSDAYTALSAMANNLEKFYSTCSVYTTDMTSASALNCATPTMGLGPSGNQSPNGYYTLTIQLPPTPGINPGGYLITATANVPGAQASDTTCHTLTLDNTGAKGAKDSNNNVTTSTCWKS